MVIKGYRVGPLVRTTAREVLDDNVLGLAAQTAYYFFLSLFPIFLFIAPVLSLVGNKQQLFGFVLRQLSTTVPPEAFALMSGVVKDVVFSPEAPGLMSIGALLAAWAGSGIFSALIDALNRAYDVEETRPWWKTKLLALACVLGAGIVLALATTVMLAGEDIVGWIARHIGLGDFGRIAWTILQYPVVIGALIGLAWALFYFLPNIRQDRKQVLVGAIVSTVLWILVTLGFRFYVQNFGSYNKTYGTIGAVIVLLTWMYISMIVVLVGGELNSELHKATGAIDPHKGATLAGRIRTGAGRSSTERVGPVEPMTTRGRE
jgi:membrane protein